MGRDGGSLKGLGQAIAGAQDEARRRLDPRPGKARLAQAALAPRRRVATPWLACGALAAAAALLFFSLRPRPIAFYTGAAQPGAVGEWIDGGKTITFSEGTRVDLDRDARARIVAIDDRGAAVVLESGRAEASIFHRDSTKWSILAGPFEVHVTGTRFETSWDARAETFELALREGSVLVTGPLLGSGRAVQAGETLRVSVREQRFALTRGGAAPTEPAATQVAPTQAAATQVASTQAAATQAAPMEAAPTLAAPAKTERGAAATELGAAPTAATSIGAASVAGVPRRATWQELAARGKYEDAMALVEVEGFDAVVARSSAHDLATLGDVTRLSSGGARTEATERAIRARFPGSAESASAAFLLGRLAFDGKGDYAEAERWFTMYLSEQPGGPLAREAEGRLLECKQRRGDEAGARDAAKRYLERYPEGPHAAKARSLLDG